jgi:hypothetical protein
MATAATILLRLRIEHASNGRTKICRSLGGDGDFDKADRCTNRVQRGIVIEARCTTERLKHLVLISTVCAFSRFREVALVPTRLMLLIVVIGSLMVASPRARRGRGYFRQCRGLAPGL